MTDDQAGASTGNAHGMSGYAELGSAIMTGSERGVVERWRPAMIVRKY
jgi:hypothetical protein